jgi:hypothetical protein
LQKLTDNTLGVGLSSDYHALSRDLVEQNNGQPLDMDDPQVDAAIFERGMKKQFGDLKRNFRGVVDNIRSSDYNSFVKVNANKAQ